MLKKNYGEALRCAMKSDQILAEGYIAGAPKNISFWLNHTFAPELLKELSAGEDTPENEKHWADAEVTVVPGGRNGTMPLIPRRHFSLVCQRILHARAARESQ